MNLGLDIPVLVALGFEEIVGAIVFILYILGQLFAGRGEAKNQPKPKRPRPQPAQEVPKFDAPAAGPPPDQAEVLRSEVDEFLRRAQGKPPRREEFDEPQPQPVKLPPPPVVVEPVPAQQESPRRLVARETATLRSEGVAEHVARHLDTHQIAAHAANLGAEVGQADERVEAHLAEKFGHKLGSLQHRETVKDDQPTQNVAADIAAMLSNPKGMRQLIVANEILRRPQW